MTPDRPRDLLAVGLTVIALIVVVVTLRGPMRAPWVAAPVPFEVPSLPTVAPSAAPANPMPARLGLPVQGKDPLHSDSGRSLPRTVSLANPPTRRQPRTPPAVPAEGWVDLESGLYVHDTMAGTGARLFKGDTVFVDFTIWLEDGRRVFSTFERPDPVRFVLGFGSVLPGIAEAVRPMRVGGRRQLRVPSDLGYGARGRGAIPPGATLRVDLQVVDVTTPRTQPPRDLPFTTRAPGLEVAVLAEGVGQALEIGDQALLDYAVWVEGGNAPIDQSFGRTEAFSVPVGLGRLWPGWDLGLLGMRTGEQRILRVAPALAFGAAGKGEAVPPDATLLVEIVLRRGSNPFSEP